MSVGPSTAARFSVSVSARCSLCCTCLVSVCTASLLANPVTSSTLESPLASGSGAKDLRSGDLRPCMSTSAVPGTRKSSRRLVAGERPPATVVLPTARVRAKLPAAPARAREGSGAPVTWKVVSMRRPNVAQSSWCDWAKIAPLLEANTSDSATMLQLPPGEKSTRRSVWKEPLPRGGRIASALQDIARHHDRTRDQPAGAALIIPADVDEQRPLGLGLKGLSSRRPTRQKGPRLGQQLFHFLRHARSPRNQDGCGANR